VQLPEGRGQAEWPFSTGKTVKPSLSSLTALPSLSNGWVGGEGNWVRMAIPHWPLPDVRDLTRYGRWSTYDVSVLKLTNVSFREKCAGVGNTLGHFPPASQAGRLAGPVFYVYVFSLSMAAANIPEWLYSCYV
jgi:hypothetical protein